MTGELAPPDGFAIGHWSDEAARTGCTVVLAPPDTRGGVDVRGGGPGTRETDVIAPLAGTSDVTAVLLTGGSAFGLAAADGVVRWCEEHERGHWTPSGLVPIVPSAVLFDLAEGDPARRPGPEEGYAAAGAAKAGIPERGPVGAGTGAAVAKVLGRERGTRAGIGYAAARSGRGETVAALAAVNAFGDVVGEGREPLAAPRLDDGSTGRTAEIISGLAAEPDWSTLEDRNTTLICLMTDAPLSKVECTRVARMASGGVARAVDPVFSDVDGDVVYCLATGEGESDRLTMLAIGTIAATVTAAAIRDAVSH